VSVPRSRRPPAFLVAAVCLLAPAVPALAAARRLSASATARQALLRRTDLGRGWSIEAAAPARAPGLTCRGFSPRLPGVRSRASVASPTFQQSLQGPFLSQVAYLYGSATQEQVAWRRIVTPRLMRCAVAALASGSGSGAHFTVTSRHISSLRRAGGAVARYRVGGSVTGSGQTNPVYLDELVLHRAALITVLDVSSFDAPPTDAVERRLTELADARLRRAGCALLGSNRC
jgi:hypothetical protein